MKKETFVEALAVEINPSERIVDCTSVCHFRDDPTCDDVACCPAERSDGKDVFFVTIQPIV